LIRRAKYIFCVILMVHAIFLTGQSKSDLREMFVSAEGDILFEDYAEALPKYLSLLQIYPENYNLYFRIGQCYLNTPGEKDKSIPFLETAVQNIDSGYHKGKFRETGAPYDALYFLANAYRITNNFDKALETYDLFMKDVDTEMYDTALVRFQMLTCLNAREMMRKPVYVLEKNLGSTINDRFSEIDPVVSADERTLLFTRELQFYDAIFWSTKVDGEWTEPVNLTPELGIDQDYYTASLSYDGRTLLLYRIDTYDGNIYSSRLEGDSWSKVEKLNSNINTKYWESHATLSRDGRKIYFTSNRKESMGGLDIFVSARDSTGDWGPAVNLGPEINTIYNEETPFLTNNDRTLFFSSRGHYNMGGYDVFRSDLDENGRWSTPVNVGYPLNTTDDDIFFTPVGKGNRGYYSRFTDDGYGRMDIFSCDIYSELNPRNFIVTGSALVSNLLDEFPQTVKITAVNKTDLSKVITALTNPVTGLFSFRLPQGTYSIRYDSEGARSLLQDIEMALDNTLDTVRLEPVLLEETDFSAYLRLLCDTLLNVTSPGHVDIDMVAEESSILNVEVISPDSVISTDRCRLDDSTFTFTFKPEKGESRVVLKLTDRFGNDTMAVVKVHRSDAPARVRKPLYHKIPARRAREKAVESLQPKVTASDTVIKRGDISSDETQWPDETGSGKACWPWWLLIAAALLFFFLLWRRKKSKKNEKDQ